MLKQYLLLCDDAAKMALERVFRGIEFLEVQGLDFPGQIDSKFLVTPICEKKDCEKKS